MPKNNHGAALSHVKPRVSLQGEGSGAHYPTGNQKDIHGSMNSIHSMDMCFVNIILMPILNLLGVVSSHSLGLSN